MKPTGRTAFRGAALLLTLDAAPIGRPVPPETQTLLQASGRRSDDTALWTYQVDVVWDAVPEPGQTRMEVGYAPLSRYRSDINLDCFPEITTDGTPMQADCIDDTARRALLSGDHDVGLSPVTHLAAPDGWRGPVGHDRLAVDKQRRADVVALCPPDAKKVSPRASRRPPRTTPKAAKSASCTARDRPA